MPHHSGILPLRAAVEPAHAALDPIFAADPARPFVVAQLGQSLDGRIATVLGDSRGINRGAALDHLHRVRAAVDAVVIGVGTAVADDPELTVRRTSGRSPARVIIDPRGRLPLGARCLSSEDDVECVVISEGPSAPGSPHEAIQLDAVDGHIPPQAIVAALFARGYRRLLIEGGAATVSAFIDAGAVDRLHVLVAPVIIGSGISGLSLAPIGRLSAALRPRTDVYVLADGDVLFDCALRA